MLWQLHKESRGTVLGADNQVMRCTNQFFFSTLILFEYSNNLSFSVFMCFKHILKLYFLCQNHPLVYQSVLSVPYKTSIGPSILLSFSSFTALLFCAPTRIRLAYSVHLNIVERNITTSISLQHISAHLKRLQKQT